MTAERQAGVFLAASAAPCTPFSQLQTLNAKAPASAKRLQEGIDHMGFIIRLYRKQVLAGSVFLHEHPRKDTSLMLDAVQIMMKEEGVMVVEAGQCMCGLKTWDIPNEISPS